MKTQLPGRYSFKKVRTLVNTKALQFSKIKWYKTHWIHFFNIYKKFFNSKKSWVTNVFNDSNDLHSIQ